jgi:hypothetical protein
MESICTSETTVLITDSVISQKRELFTYWIFAILIFTLVILLEAVGLERGPLSLLRINEELLE